MSQELNQPAQSEQQPQQPQQPKRDNTKIYWAIIVLLLISNIYFIVTKNKVTEQRDQVQAEFNFSDSSRKSVEADYNAALVRLDDLVSKNDQMQNLLGDKDGEIAKLRSQIDAIIKNKNATAAELGKAKRLINLLNSKVQTYEERIANLESDNERLGVEKDMLLEERDALDAEREQLAKLGSILHVSNIRMTPIDIKRGGKKVSETQKAKRVDVMRIMFDIDENRIKETSVTEFFLRITGPEGTVLSNAAYGSGVTALDDGSSINYTLSKLIEVQKNNKISDVVVDWNQDSDYKTGDYRIEIYQGGFKVGSGNVTLR
jgi:peptidoglycan hydrolase CwlO-like protein